MAHNLNFKGGKASFASVGKAWHGLGQVLTERMTAEQALKFSQLDYSVIKIPSFVEYEGSQIATGEYSTLRTDTKQILGNVGGIYTILQNRDAFSFFDPIVDRDEAIYETAGALGDGERIFLTAKMPDYIQVGKGDELELFVVFTNSHDGRTPAQAIITPIRVVCQNTLSAALKKGGDRVTLRHTKNLEEKLKQAHQVLNLTSLLKKELEQTFNHIRGVKIPENKVNAIFKNFLGMNVDDRMNSTRIQNQYTEISRYYHEGPGQTKVMGTGWGVYNAMTGYISHLKSFKNESTKMTSILEGVDSAKALKLVLDYK